MMKERIRKKADKNESIINERVESTEETISWHAEIKELDRECVSDS